MIQTPSRDGMADAVNERDRYVADIRMIFPRARWRDIDFMLWNMTAWPVCGNSHAIRQLLEIRDECGPDVKRGWWRKVCRMARRIDRQMVAENRSNLAAMEAGRS